MRNRALIATVTLAAGLVAAEPAPKTPTPEAPSSDELYQAGKALFDELAPPEVKEQFEFPSKESWDAFAVRLQQALDQDNLAALAEYEPEARAALAALRIIPGYEDYADWLEAKIDYIEVAKQVAKLPPPAPGRPGLPPAPPGVEIPYYSLWLSRLQTRPVPAGAAQVIPLLQAAFVAEGVPAELVWLVEVESRFNSAARSPSGAKGLFQLMAVTARSLGLSTFLPDERTNPEKSARAAARYLRTLHGRFGDWPLALAAYNAGGGRVRRLLDARQARTFSEVSAGLPAETRMYVPKVCATIAVRTGVSPDRLPRPSR